MVWMFCARHRSMPVAIDVVNYLGAGLFPQMIVQSVPPTSLGCHPQM